eukprot:TRINITY_DN11313_c0_g2_i1.p1 TRINITY_DN11313_c0_g2~~TRINITY_DN11313_c0_g2_i1.p1  ORF type:complete len:304 (+),score=34.38 TRINITY_DN11313_c0_g2_i1:70-912(+)
MNTTPSLTFSEFNHIIHNLYAASIPQSTHAQFPSFFTIKYVDDENDLITLSHDLELDEAWQFATQSSSNPLLRIVLSPSTKETKRNSLIAESSTQPTQTNPQGFNPFTRRRSSNSLLNFPSSLSQTVLSHTMIPTDSMVISNTYFIKTWTIQNDGNVQWPGGCKLNYFSGDFLSTTSESINIPTLKPNEEATLSIVVRAPSAFGRYNMEFKMESARYGRFGERLRIDILVTEEEPIIVNNSELALDKLEELGFPDRIVNEKLLQTTPDLLNSLQSLLTQL